MSEEELAKLREEFPYRDALHGTLYSPLDVYQTPETTLSFLSSRSAFGAFLAEVHVTSDPFYHIGYKKYPGRYESVEDFIAQHPELEEDLAQKIFWAGFQHQVDAEITGILWGDAEVSVGTAISIVFDHSSTLDTSEIFQNGGRYVCALSGWSGASPYSVLPHITTKYLTWHITKDDVILSATSEPGPDSFSGLYLESFKQEVLAILNEE